MMEWAVALPFGLAVGGLALSACWGLFWLGIATVGLVRGTCGRRAWLSGLAMGGTSLAFAAALLWGLGETGRRALPFQLGLVCVPLLLSGLAWRQAPDGRRAGAHLIDGVRQLAGQLLGRHRDCGGCCGERHGEPS